MLLSSALVGDEPAESICSFRNPRYAGSPQAVRDVGGGKLIATVRDGGSVTAPHAEPLIPRLTSPAAARAQPQDMVTPAPP